MTKSRRLMAGLTALVGFLFAIQMLGRSTEAAIPLLRPVMVKLIDGNLSGLGSGWIAAELVMNGSVIAALGLSFLKSTIITAEEYLMVLAGSRLGASFIVVVIGMLEYLQGKNNDIEDSMSIGILAFLVTYIVYIPATIVSVAIFEHTSFLALEGPPVIKAGLAFLFQPLIEEVMRVVPAMIVFLLAFALLFGSLRLFDRAFSYEERFQGKWMRFILRYRWISFLAGLLVTAVTTSVAISIGLIVPMYNKGFFKRSDLVPYILGANLSTITDTVAAAVVLGTPSGIQAIFTLTLVAGGFTILFMGFYSHFFRLLKFLFDRTLTDRRFLTAFFGILLVAPILLLIL